ncbi:LamB/YcsF family protein [bacterium]|nr:LamB/YcsF family protein [bacterium]
MEFVDRAFDLNADLGEGCGYDDRLMPLVTSASVATGAHAGDDSVAMATMMLARRHGVVVGAHPGYPDREHFGRKAQRISADQVERLVFDQCAHLVKLARSIGVAIPYVKPHGALYNQAVVEAPVALGLVRAVGRLGMGLMTMPTGEAARLAAKHGLPVVREGFVDRGYDDCGTLLARSAPGAVLTDPVEIRSQFVELIESGSVDSICIHGDHASSVELARNVNLWAEELGWTIRSVWQRVDHR